MPAPTATGNLEEQPLTYRLSRGTTTITDLWKEYAVGLGGQPSADSGGPGQALGFALAAWCRVPVLLSAQGDYRRDQAACGGGKGELPVLPAGEVDDIEIRQSAGRTASSWSSDAEGSSNFALGT
jgi:hypothetical protein